MLFKKQRYKIPSQSARDLKKSLYYMIIWQEDLKTNHIVYFCLESGNTKKFTQLQQSIINMVFSCENLYDIYVFTNKTVLLKLNEERKPSIW